MWLFGFKASSVQRYFFLDNLILCCSYSESQTELRAIAELSSPTREICRPTTSYLMMQQLEHAARRSHRDGNQPNSAILPDQCLFCKKSKYKPYTKTREKLHRVQEVCAGDLNVPYPANYMLRYRRISAQNEQAAQCHRKQARYCQIPCVTMEDRSIQRQARQRHHVRDN